MIPREFIVMERKRCPDCQLGYSIYCTTCHATGTVTEEISLEEALRDLEIMKLFPRLEALERQVDSVAEQNAALREALRQHGHSSFLGTV